MSKKNESVRQQPTTHIYFQYLKNISYIAQGVVYNAQYKRILLLLYVLRIQLNLI